MSDDQWFLPNLRPEALSRGDLVASVLFGTPEDPAVFLKLTAYKGNRQGWDPSAAPVGRKPGDASPLYVLSRGRTAAGLVLSHDCDIDKPGADRILVAPVLPLSAFPDNQHGDILRQRMRPIVPLPSVAELGTCCADLRSFQAVPKSALLSQKRIASMTDFGRQRLDTQLVAFLVRRVLPD